MTVEARLWLIRHAPVDGPRGIIHAADAAADLTDTQRLDVLRATLPTDAVAYCSSARRTVETALALGLDPIHDAAFAEQNFGTWTGRRHSDIAQELGGAYDDFWRKPAHNRPPGGESFADQTFRVAVGLAHLPAGDVILVVHSGTIRAALASALEIRPQHALRFVIDPLSLTRLDRLDEGWRIGGVNQR